MSKSLHRKLSIAVFLLSLAFLIPGLILPVMTIKATVDRQEMMNMATETLFPPDKTSSFIQGVIQTVLLQLNVEGSVDVFVKTRSMLGTMSDLIKNGHIVVGMMIGLFAVIIPVTKIMLVLIAVCLNSTQKKSRILKINSLMSKWSMSDVFVMAIIVTYLATNANEQSAGAVQMSAELGSGFYYFVVYCLLAIVGGKLIEPTQELAQTAVDKTVEYRGRS